jgi:hypothetical protein
MSDNTTPGVSQETVINTGTEEVEKLFENFSSRHDQNIGVLPAATYAQLAASKKVVKESNLWIWGQTNRILPIKAILRFIAHAIPPNARSLDYDDLITHLQQPIGLLGSFLELQDETNKKEKGDGISTAFPSVADNEKAHSRLNSIFLGYVRQDGRWVGAMPLLRFTAFEEVKGKNKIGLTEFGLSFAAIPNPVLDNRSYDQALSEEETQFYLEHIRLHVPGELTAFKLLVGAIRRGLNTPEKLNRRVSDAYPLWSAAMVNTQRAGTVSRLVELGVVSRQMNGKNVKYTCTEIGQQFTDIVGGDK